MSMTDFATLIGQLASGMGRDGVTFDMGAMEEGCDEGTIIVRSDDEAYEVVLNTSAQTWTVEYRSPSLNEDCEHLITATVRGDVEIQGWDGVECVIDALQKLAEEV